MDQVDSEPTSEQSTDRFCLTDKCLPVCPSVRPSVCKLYFDDLLGRVKVQFILKIDTSFFLMLPLQMCPCNLYYHQTI